MRRATSIQKDLYQTSVIEDLTEVFESIASIRISKIRNRVVASKSFFAELWNIYQSLRVNPKEHLARSRHGNNRTVFLGITSQSKLGGTMDEQVINSLLTNHTDPSTTDIMVIGAHGAQLLAQMNVRPVKVFQMPASDVNFSVTDMVEALTEYKQISVFYQTYDSLRVQKAVQIELISAIQELSADVKDQEAVEIVSSRDYIFEPDLNKITEYLESVMFGVALIQVIMESKLAQYANRFNNMSRAKQRADELRNDYKLQYHRAKRAESDERLKEIVKSIKMTRSPA